LRAFSRAICADSSAPNSYNLGIRAPNPHNVAKRSRIEAVSVMSLANAASRRVPKGAAEGAKLRAVVNWLL
jgi:hypothetical protein